MNSASSDRPTPRAARHSLPRGDSSHRSNLLMTNVFGAFPSAVAERASWAPFVARYFALWASSSLRMRSSSSTTSIALAVLVTMREMSAPSEGVRSPDATAWVSAAAVLLILAHA
jgi:hypothetical protein